MHARIPSRSTTLPRCLQCIHRQAYQDQRATMATTTVPAPSISRLTTSIPPIMRFPPQQPPSYKPADQRKSQLLRQYASLLRSTPLMVLFQHNNLQSTEWMGIRRELTKALRKVDDSFNHHTTPGSPSGPALSEQIRIQTVQTGIFAVALRIVEFYRPHQDGDLPTIPATDPRTNSSATHIPATTSSASDSNFTHVLSTAAHSAVVNKAHKRRKHPLDPLLAGPLALLTFPEVSPAHLKAALSILAPFPPLFPAPTRRANPAYHELNVQRGLQKLMILGARIEGRVTDAEATRGVGMIEGGMEGLRAQLVGILQGVGMGLMGALEGPGRGVYVTMEGRRMSMEEEEKKETKED